MKKILLLALTIVLLLTGCNNQTQSDNKTPQEDTPVVTPDEKTPVCNHAYISTTLKEATCTEKGSVKYECRYCGISYEETLETTEHKYLFNKCEDCGEKAEDSYLYTLFGEDIDIYTNGERNPYGIDLDKYGDNVKVYVYEPNIITVGDIYVNVNKNEFYANYEPATTYEDAYYRTKHYLMSGDITDQYYLPNNDGKIMKNDQAVRLTDATYVLDADGNYLAYIPNVIDGDNYIIFYGAAYTSLNEVAAYLLAFGEAPANQIANKNSTGQKTAIANWGKYGRVNDNRFSGDTSSYPYEPELPNILGTNSIRYHEIDFGTTGGYTTSNSVGYNKTQVVYNNGSSITRGAARIVYVADTNVKNINNRYVFYTYTHYNDFQEYLNYHDGWGIRFGNESAGNEYCSGTKDYYNLGCVPPTPYPQVLFEKLKNL